MSICPANVRPETFCFWIPRSSLSLDRIIKQKGCGVDAKRLHDQSYLFVPMRRSGTTWTRGISTYFSNNRKHHTRMTVSFSKLLHCLSRQWSLEFSCFLTWFVGGKINLLSSSKLQTVRKSSETYGAKSSLQLLRLCAEECYLARSMCLLNVIQAAELNLWRKHLPSALGPTLVSQELPKNLRAATNESFRYSQMSSGVLRGKSISWSNLHSTSWQS